MENIIFNISICLIGLYGLFYGGNKLVTGSVSTANIFKVNPQLVAVTIIALGTSFPELVVSVNAVLENSPGIAWGNVVGSNISNILLVLGLASLVGTLSLKNKISNKNIFWLLISTLIFFFVCVLLRNIPFFIGISYIVLLFIIIYHLTSSSIKPSQINRNNKIKTDELSIKKSIFYIIIGIVILIISAEVVVNSSIIIASFFNVPETFVGLTIIAIGTSLPEIAASIIAVKKGYSEVAIGNVIGSNIFNSMGIIGAAAIFTSSGNLVVPKSFITFDIPIMLTSTFLFCLLIYYKDRISKYIGVMFVLTYFVYILINLKIIQNI